MREMEKFSVFTFWLHYLKLLTFHEFFSVFYCELCFNCFLDFRIPNKEVKKNTRNKIFIKFSLHNFIRMVIENSEVQDFSFAFFQFSNFCEFCLFYTKFPPHAELFLFTQLLNERRFTSASITQ